MPGFQFIQDPLDYNSRIPYSNMDVYDRLQKDDLEQATAMMKIFVSKAAIIDELFTGKRRNGNWKDPGMLIPKKV